MRAFPEIEAELRYEKIQRLKRAAPRAGPAPAAPPPGAWIEGLALAGEPPEALRGRIEAAYAAFAPELPTEAALVDQAIIAQLEIQRCHSRRATIRAAKVRTAVRDFAWAQDDEVHRLWRGLDGAPRNTVRQLERSAAGVRSMILCWEKLGRQLEQDGTWYGGDRMNAIMLGGHSAMVEDLYFSEPAYWIWVRCLAAQPNPKPRDIELVLDRRVMPKRLQDMDNPVWRPDPEESRAHLRALVDESLASLRPLEVQLRTEYEEPARAEAVERALARVDKDEQQLLRELRGHERSLAQAHKALANRGGRGFNTGTCPVRDRVPPRNREVFL